MIYTGLKLYLMPQSLLRFAERKLIMEDFEHCYQEIAEIRGSTQIA